MNDDERNDTLIAAASRLSTDISPEQDLWPGIGESIAQPRRRGWMPMFAQAAVVVLLIGASSGLTYFVTKSQQQPVHEIAPELLFERASFGGRYTLGLDYQDAHSDLAAQLEDELLRLSPEARADVEKNLAIIRSAIGDINAALEGEPESALLQELLLNTYREELSLMQRVGGLAQRVMSRKDI
ncbi:MAG: hypothetical protein GWP02_05365 [Desulfobulbaceae bacterium]|nr:hypothetical protein [Desulfobulbaceae bacterium]